MKIEALLDNLSEYNSSELYSDIGTKEKTKKLE